MNHAALHSAILVAAFSIASAQQSGGTIMGTVIDAETGQPLVGANIMVIGSLRGAATDIDGKYTVSHLPAGTYVLTASSVGFRRKESAKVEVQAGGEVTVDFLLTSSPVESDQVVVTASRREQSLREVPASIEVISASVLAERMTVTLDDALRHVPGVNMVQDQINIRGSSGYSRGVGSRVLLLLDGLPFLTGDTGEISWETIPVHMIDRVEVVKGAGSALYGSSALGGVVNVITRATSAKPEVRWRLYSGYYDKPRYAEWDWSEGPRFHSGGFVSYSGRGNDVGYLVSVGRSVDESYRQNDVYHRWSYFTKISWDLTPTRNVSVLANLLHRTHGNYFWWKSLREATRPADIQLNGVVVSRRGNVSVAFKEVLSESMVYSLKGIYLGNFWKDDSAGRPGNVSASHIGRVEGQLTYEASRFHLLTFGVTANYDRVYSNLFGSHPGVGTAVYAQDEIGFSADLRATVGFRYDWQRVSALPAGSQFNPKVGVVYTPTPGTTTRASFGAGYRYPSISELYTNVRTSVTPLRIVPNTALRPETSLSYEVGVTQVLSERFALEGAVFLSDFHHLIEAGVKAVRSDSFIITFENVTRARIRGFEAGIKTELVRHTMYVDAGYTSTDPVDRATGTILKFRPRHLFYTTGMLRFGPARVSVDGRYVSRIEAIDDNLVRLAPIIHGEYRVPIKVVDLRLALEGDEWGVPLRIGFNITNVFNYHYVELVGNLAPVRMYMLSLGGVW